MAAEGDDVSIFQKNPLGALRTSAGWPNGAKTARKLRISKDHLYGIEGGWRRPSDDLLARMAELYGCEAARLREIMFQQQDDWRKRVAEAFRRGGSNAAL